MPACSPILPGLPPQRGATAAVRARLQPGELPALARLAERGGAVVAHDSAQEAGQDRRPDRAARRYMAFQLAEVAVPRTLFAEILRRIDRLRGSPVPAT